MSMSQRELETINELIEKVNTEIKETARYLKYNEECFDMIDLKLHDVSSYYGSDEMKKDFPLTYDSVVNDGFYINSCYFNNFCDMAYEVFKEDLKCNDIDFESMRNQVGRTSKFYLHDKSIIEHDKHGELWTEYTIENIIDYLINELSCLYCSDGYFDIKCNKINLYKDKDTSSGYCIGDEQDLIYVLKTIVTNLYDVTFRYCEDIIFVYNYIKDYKANQVEYFKDYLENNVEIELQHILDCNKKAIAESEKTIKEIEKKYNITSEDAELYKSACIILYDMLDD